MDQILNLSYLLKPLSVTAFLEKHWENLPLYLSRNEHTYYSRLPDEDQMWSLVNKVGDAAGPMVEILGDPESEGPPSPAQSPNIALDAFKRGASLRIREAHVYLQSLTELCIRLEHELSFPVRANVYISPSGGQGLDRHYDSHDVFVLQTCGSKNWDIFEPLVSLPLENLPPLAFEKQVPGLRHERGNPVMRQSGLSDEESGRFFASCTLKRGDLLYLPRGFVHCAKATESVSIHVTVGIYVLTWLDLLTVALGNAALKDELLRKALPVGFARVPSVDPRSQDYFDQALERLRSIGTADRALWEIGNSLFANSSGKTVKTPTNETDASPIIGESQVQHAPGVKLRLLIEKDSVAIASTENSFSLPPAFKEMLSYVVTTDRFRVNQIPTTTSERSKALLIENLIRKGLLIPSDLDDITKGEQ